MPDPAPTGLRPAAIWSATTKMALANALLACPNMASRASRDAVIGLLPSTLRNSPRSDSALTDVVNLVNTALNYESGMADLIEAVRSFERDSLPMIEVERLVAEATSRPRALPGSMPFNLRPPVADFTGREADIRTLVDALCCDATGTAAAISGIRGMGGIGKTELALKVAEALRDHYSDAGLLLELQPGNIPLTPEALLSQVISAFQPEAHLPDDLTSLQAHYRRTLTGRRGVLLLDNAADGAQVRSLLPPPAGWALIVTSRATFPLPGGKMHTLDLLPDADAVTLLRRVLSDGGREDIVDAETLAVSAELSPLHRLAEACGHLPLALRVAGSYLCTYDDWSLDDYLGELAAARLQALEAPGEPSVRATLRLSLDRLTEADATRWHALGVFPAPFDRAAAAAVWGLRDPEARQALSMLVQQSLVDYNPEKQTYSLHDLLAELAREHPVTDIQRFHHASYFLDRARPTNMLYEQGGEHIAEAVRLFDAVWPHLLAAWHALTDRVDKRALRWLAEMPDAVRYVFDLRVQPRLKIEILKSALAAAQDLKWRQVEGAHLGNLGVVFDAVGEQRQAIAYLEQALAIARKTGDRQGEGGHLGNLGNVYWTLGETRRALASYEQALTLARKTLHRRGQGSALGNLGNVYWALGEPRRAIEYFERTLAIDREIGDRRGESTVLNNSGRAYADLGEPRRALSYYERSLAIDRELGDRGAQGLALANLGRIHAVLGETTKAIAACEESLRIRREMGDAPGEGEALNFLGYSYDTVGDHYQAAAYHLKGINFLRAAGHRVSLLTALLDLAESYIALGQFSRAHDCAQEALQIARQIEARRIEGLALKTLGRVAQLEGNEATAREYWQTSRIILEQLDLPEAATVCAWLTDLTSSSAT